MAGEVTEEGIPVEQWIQHPSSDYVDWMEKEGVYVGDLTPEQRQAYEAAKAEREAAPKK